MAENGDVSLRPMALRPGGGQTANPFAQFGKGLGFGIKSKQKSQLITPMEERQPKKTGERIRYTKEFLMGFMEKFNQCPVELQQLSSSNIDIVVTEGEGRIKQQEALQKAAEEIDDRDWRMRDTAPASREFRELRETRDFREPRDAPREAPRENREPKESRPVRETRPAAAASQDAPQQAQQQPQQQQPQAAPAPQQKQAEQGSLKIQTAAEIGRQAYKPGAVLSNEERAIRSVKGILNKLTPEKFERLLQQLLEVITTADILKQTISLVFENAVEQPTYCAMYAELCVSLSKELPSFPPPTGADRPLAFKQILLNTCQDEFEGAEVAREQLASISDAYEREDKERLVKKRVMGNMRLISELYKQDMVKEWIITTCLDELLATRTTKTSKLPPEDNIEAVCEMISTAGAKLFKSDKVDAQKKMDKLFKELARMADERGLASRIRFLIKDVLELKRSNWVPRREVFTAKKLDDIRSQAEAELGMISSTLAASLPSLPSQVRQEERGEFSLLPPLRSDAGEGMGLFPAFRGENTADRFSGSSALLGDFVPPPKRAVAPAAAPAAPPPVAQAAPAKATLPPGAELSEDDLKRKCDSLYQEYISTLDKLEALTCVRELSTTKTAKVLELGLQQVLDSLKEKEQDALCDLLLFLHSNGAVSSEDVIEALTTFCVQLEDLCIDVPKAPVLLGTFFGRAVEQGILGIDLLPQLLDGEELTAEPKRRFSASAFKLLKTRLGDSGLTELCAAKDLHAKSFLEADPELDVDAPSVEEFLKKEGLSMVPL